MNAPTPRTAIWPRIVFLVVLSFGPLHSTTPLHAQAFDETEYGSLSQQFMKHFDAAQYREAEAPARRILEIVPRLYPGKPLPHGKALQNLAEVLLRLGKLDEAESLAAQGIMKFQQVGEPGRLALADGYDLKGRIETAAVKFTAGEASLKKGLEIREGIWGPLHDQVGKSHLNLGALYVATRREVEAEKSLKSAINIFERMLGPEHLSVADAATNLGNLMEDLGRTRDAEANHLRALRIYEKLFGDDGWAVAQALQNLANSYQSQGRFAEAESTSRRALRVYQKTLPAGHPSIGDLLNNLGNIADDQGRPEEAVRLYQDALSNYQQAYGPMHTRVAMALNNLALSQQSLGRYDEAESLLRQAHELRVKTLGEWHAETLATLSNIGSNHWNRGRFEEAEKTDELLLSLRRKVLGTKHPEVIASLRNLAVTSRSLKKLPRSEELLSQAIELALAQVGQPRDVATLYDLRARTRYELQRPQEAIQDLQEAINYSELQRHHASGGEVERGNAFAQQGDIYERMIAWSIERNDLREAWAAAERSRARTLLDQLELRGADLLAGVPWKVARPLRKRDADAKLRLARFEQNLQSAATAAGLSPIERERQVVAAEKEVLAARREVIEAYRDIRNASPAYRQMVSQDFQATNLATIDSWLTSAGAVMLRYFIGTQSSWVFILRPGQAPEVVSLSTGSQANQKSLKEAAALTHIVLRRKLLGNSPGLLSQMSDPASADDAVDGLHELWKILIPDSFREELAQQKYRQLVVIPDGALAMLPFETLVVEPHEDPLLVKYLLDQGSPIVYAPSATVLINLAKREPVPENRGVLTLGNAIYTARTPSTARGTPALRYRELGGRFPPLPQTAIEAQSVSKAFATVDPPVKLLQREAATETAVRQEVAKKRIVHLACHGFCDDAHHNFFGALVVTPGPSRDDSANDGFITVAELVELPLSGCELSILSACETNLGPQQQGEAAWALSRGFLAAGSRRVIASDWLVDDQAAATLIGHLCDGLAESQAKGLPLDVAAQLQAAKRAVRATSKWNNPHFWGSFVLVGPP